MLQEELVKLKEGDTMRRITQKAMMPLGNDKGVPPMIYSSPIHSLSPRLAQNSHFVPPLK